jgi:cytochrome P450
VPAAPALPPGPALPRPLQTLGWITRPGPFLQRCHARYGDVFTLRIGGGPPWALLADPGAIREVFTGDPRVLHAGQANVILRPLLGPRSVLLLDDDAHLAERRRLLPAFHGARIARLAALMADATSREVAAWPRGTPVELLPRLQALTLEIVVRAIFGVREEDRRERLREGLRTALDWASDPRRFAPVALLGARRTEALGIISRAFAPVDALLAEEIARRRSAPGLEGRDDVLSSLIAAGEHDDRALRDELMTLLVAGHETTASALAWALERLARHPGAWARVRAGDEAYTEAVVKETLRLRPVLAIVLRLLTEPLEIAGHRLPAGVAVAPCIFLLHRRADLYPDPLRFRPERFLGEDPPSYAWIPFGGGTRRCLGASFALLEMRTVLAAIAAHADLRAAEAPDEPARRRAVTLAPARGARVVVG